MYRTIRPGPSRPRADAAPVVTMMKAGQPTRTGRAALDLAVDRACKRPDFSADPGSARVVEEPAGNARAVLVGLGDPGQINAEAWRRAAAAAVRAAFAARLTALHWTGPDPADHARAIADGSSLANFDFNDYRGATREADQPIDLALTLAGGKAVAQTLRERLLLGECVAATRRLAATPPNIANPAYLAGYCRKLARKVGLQCSVIDKARAKQLGMGGLLAVGSGGSAPPAIIVLEWNGRASSPAKPKTRNPKPENRNPKPILLVGKAVTFDTGGYSLKPGGGKGMKYDKSGGAAVIGVMQAVATLKLRRRVVALIPAVENMIDAAAYRVDDIITFTNGVTCEVTNTDAEGRLILADALAYGTKRYKPRAVIDVATLTGGMSVALGPWHAGLYANDDALAAQLLRAGDEAGEKLWRLPLTDELRQFMKGGHGDLVNSNEKRWAHAGQGAAFLSYFIGDDAPRKMPALPWAHLDIAAVAETDGSTTLQSKGPTGFGVRLVFDWLSAV